MNDTIYRQDAINVLEKLSACQPYGEEIGTEEETYIGKYEAITALSDLPSTDRPQKVVAQVTFDEEKLREIIKEAVERFKEEYEITDRPQGEWVGEADGYYNGELVYDTWYCSNCDYVVDDEEPPTWNFCPNCGARMKGVGKNPLAGIEPKSIPTRKHTFVYRKGVDDGE